MSYYPFLITASGLTLTSNSDATGPYLNLLNPDTTGNDLQRIGSINFLSSDITSNASGIRATIRAEFEDTSGGTNLIFATADNSTAALVDSLVISAEGRMGWGTYNPTTALEIRTTGTIDPIKLSNATGTVLNITDLTQPPTKVGDVLICSDDVPVLNDWAPQASLSPNKWFVFTEDFTYDVLTPSLGGTAMYTAGTSGTAAAFSYQGSDNNHWGIVQLSTGTTGTGRGGLITNNTAVFLASNDAVFEAAIKIQQIGTSTTQESTIRIGWMNNYITDPADGVYFKIDLDGTPTWILSEIDSGGTEFGTDSTIAVAANTWYLLRIEYDGGTNDATYYVNGTSVGTRSTVSPANSVGFGFQIEKTTGATAHTVQVDYFHCHSYLPNGR